MFSYNLKSTRGVTALLMATVWWLVSQCWWKQKYGSVFLRSTPYVSDVYIWGGENTSCALLRLVVVVVSNFNSSKGEKILERSVPDVRGFSLFNVSLYGSFSVAVVGMQESEIPVIWMIIMVSLVKINSNLTAMEWRHTDGPKLFQGKAMECVSREPLTKIAHEWGLVSNIKNGTSILLWMVTFNSLRSRRWFWSI